MARFSVALAELLVASLTLTEMENVPDALGVPETAPDKFKDNPEGKPVAFHVYGAVPPLAASVVV